MQEPPSLCLLSLHCVVDQLVVQPSTLSDAGNVSKECNITKFLVLF